MKAFYVLRRANDGQCQIFDYATHQPVIEPGFDFLHAAVEWLDSHRRFSGDYEMVELAEAQPSRWWVHGPVLAHLGAAGLDALSSWKQPEANGMYRQQSGPFAGRFYTTGAARMAGVTIGLTSASEILSALKPRWRRAIGALNLGAAGAHGGASAYNLAKNPNSR